MKKNKFIAVLVMTLLCITGCSTSENTVSTGSNVQNKTTLFIGGIVPLTGSASIYGVSVKNGADIAVEEINNSGGINGMEIEILFQDDENNPEKATDAYNYLKDKGIKSLIGTATGMSCVAVADLSFQDNMFQITPSASSVQCIANPNVFRIGFSDPNQGIFSANYISDRNLARKIAVIYDSSDAYSSVIYEKFASEVKKTGIEIVAVEPFTKDSSTDFSMQLLEIKDSGAELVFMPVYYEQAALILRQADSIGLDAEFFGCDAVDGVIEQLGESSAYADGLMILTSFSVDSKNEKTTEFVNKFKEKYNEIPNQFAADGYDAVITLKTAIEKAGIKDSNISVSEFGNMLIKVMTEIEVDGVTGKMKWDNSGEPDKEPGVMIIEGGLCKGL